MQPRRILVPVDFSPASRAAVDQALMLARAFDARIDLLHVLWEPPPYVSFEALTPYMPYGPDDDMTRFMRRSTERLIDALLAEVDEPWRSRLGRRVALGDTAETIVRVAHDDDIDLIVMGTHGRQGISHLLLGSVTEKVVQHASCPVMTVPAWKQ